MINRRRYIRARSTTRYDMQISKKHGTTPLGPELGNRGARYAWLTVEVRYICSFFFSKTEAEGRRKKL